MGLHFFERFRFILFDECFRIGDDMQVKSLLYGPYDRIECFVGNLLICRGEFLCAERRDHKTWFMGVELFFERCECVEQALCCVLFFFFFVVQIEYHLSDVFFLFEHMQVGQEQIEVGLQIFKALACPFVGMDFAVNCFKSLNQLRDKPDSLFNFCLITGADCW